MACSTVGAQLSMTLENQFSKSSLRYLYVCPFSPSSNMYDFMLSDTITLATAICEGLNAPRTSPSEPATNPFAANWKSTNPGSSNVTPYVSTTPIKALKNFLYSSWRVIFRMHTSLPNAGRISGPLQDPSSDPMRGSSRSQYAICMVLSIEAQHSEHCLTRHCTTSDIHY